MGAAEQLADDFAHLSIFDSLAVPVLVCDERGVAIYANPGFERSFSLRQRSVRNKKLEEVFVGLDPSLCQQALSSNCLQNSGEQKIAIGDSERILNLTVCPVDSLLGKSLQGRLLVISLEDTTVEAGLHAKYKAQLAEIQRNSVELIRVASLAALGEISAGLTHDAKNILTSVAGQVEIALLRLAQDKDVSTPLNKALFSCQRLGDLLGHVTSFTKRVSKVEYFELRQCLMNALIFVENRLKRAGIKLVTNFDHDVPMIKGSSHQFEHIFLNLFVNAIDAISATGNRETGRIVVSVRRDGQNNVTIAFEDNGCGISRENLDRVFEAFYTQKENGTGLGLSITHKIVDLHEGKIRIESDGKSGSTFTIELPEGVQVGDDG